MLPEAFLERMRTMLGPEYEQFVESLAGERYQALRFNALKRREDGKTAAEVLPQDAPFHMTKVSWAKDGYYYEKDDLPGKHPLHEAGAYYIQEPSAMAPVSLLGVKPGEQILDLCAAPGGKSTQIAAQMEGEGLLVCNEIHPQRAKILSENVERMGITNACVTNETPKHLAAVFPAFFDRILVDAPCSGEGMFRKNEEASEEWSPENVVMCGERQDEILDCAAIMLRPGGRMVYSTCTFAPIENEGSISRFLERHPEFTILPIDKNSLGIEGDGVAEYVENPAPGIEQTLRLWPHKLKGEGHYVACLQKEGEVPEGYRATAVGGMQFGISEKELLPYREFEEAFMKVKLQGEFLKFGENIYRMPQNMPALKGLKVLRPGLQLGEVKKNRFEPSHALALAIDPNNAKNVYNFSLEDKLARDYLNGLTFPAEGEKGWHLICVDGFGLGWGKLAGGIMKNHYPKGLRK